MKYNISAVMKNKTGKGVRLGAILPPREPSEMLGDIFGCMTGDQGEGWGEDAPGIQCVVLPNTLQCIRPPPAIQNYAAQNVSGQGWPL